MTLTTNEIIYSDIKQELDILFKISPENENLATILKAAEYFKDNKEALLVIRNWLKNINNWVLKVKQDEQAHLSAVIKNILDSIEYS